jgi:deoxyadenosine/deoxycytidine kinase
MFLSILGLIGAGKSTLVENLASKSNFIPYREPVESNPFLELYYQDPVRWSYAMQVNLLFERYKQSQEAFLRSSAGEDTVIDSSIYSDAAFALVQRQSNYFTDKEYVSYLNMHKVIAAQTAYPEITIWLELDPESTQKRIISRSRACESNIPIKYLSDLYNAYKVILDKIKGHTKIISVDARESADKVYNNVVGIINEYKSNNSQFDIKYY